VLQTPRLARSGVCGDHRGVALRPLKSVVVVPTEDLATALEFYCDGLGLELVEEWSELGRGALLRLSDEADLELIQLDGVVRPPEPRVGIGLEVEEPVVDEVHARLVARGFTVKGPPTLRPWGKRGFGAIDPSGVPVNVYGPQRPLP
jgi:catechol 2,3-dioxygenase-like lactoylglutathione lyase family enzyme